MFDFSELCFLAISKDLATRLIMERHVASITNGTPPGAPRRRPGALPPAGGHREYGRQAR